MCRQGGKSLPENTEWKKKEDLQKTRRTSGRARVSRIMLVFYFLTPSCQERAFSLQLQIATLPAQEAAAEWTEPFRNRTTKVPNYRLITPLAWLNNTSLPETSPV